MDHHFTHTSPFPDNKMDQQFTKMVIIKGKSHIADMFRVRKSSSPIEKLVKTPGDVSRTFYNVHSFQFELDFILLIVTDSPLILTKEL